MKLRINDGLIKLIPLLFDGSPATIVAELLQNCRRAGATTVRVELSSDTEKKEVEVSVADNGIGMGLPEIESLMSLTGSGWTDEKVRAEVPAGMGFMSLVGAKSITIHTVRDGVLRVVRLSPENFVGAPFEVEEGATGDGPSGTTVKFTHKYFPGERSNSAWKEAFDRILPLCGVENVFMDGSEIETHDFLDRYEFVKSFPEIGIRIGARCVQSLAEDCLVNFYGIRLNGQRQFGLKHFSVGIDVARSSHVKMVLPARNAVHADSADLGTYVKEVCAGSLLGSKHRIPYDHWKELQTFVPDIPEAEPTLKRAAVGNDDCTRSSRLEENAIVSEVRRFFPEEGDQCFLVYKASDFLKVPVYQGDKEMRGYSWYDDLPKITNCQIIVNNAPATQPPAGLVDSIVARYEILEKGKTRTVDVSIPYAMGMECSQSYFDGVWFAFTKEFVKGRDAVDGMVGELTDVYFDPSYDSDSDMPATQRERFQEEAEEFFTELLVNKDTMLADSIMRVLGNHYGHDISARSIVFSKFPGREATFESDEATVEALIIAASNPRYVRSHTVDDSSFKKIDDILANPHYADEQILLEKLGDMGFKTFKENNNIVCTRPKHQ